MDFPSLDRWLLDAYLRRLGFEAGPEPSCEALFALHRAHSERVPYEMLWQWHGQSRSCDPLESLENIANGWGGNCYQLNGAFATALNWLGFDVRLHVAGVQHTAAAPANVDGDHLGLSVVGLPTAGCPEGAWLVDVGLGDGPYEPIPLRYGEYRQGPFTYCLRPSGVSDGWRLDHDPRGAIVGIDIAADPAAPRYFVEKHEAIARARATGIFVARRDVAGVDAMSGRVIRRVDATGRVERELTGRNEWFTALTDVFGLSLAGLPPTNLDRLWAASGVNDPMRRATA